MNKKMRDLLSKIEAKTAEARGYMDGENKDVKKAAVILDEVQELKAEFETEKRLYELEKAENTPAEKEVKEKKAAKTEEETLKAFGRAAKNGFKVAEKDESTVPGALNEGTPADGGYTVPEDIYTMVENFRQAEFSFLHLVRRERVHTATGARTFKKRAQYSGFNLVPEGGKIGPVAEAPQFERLAWAIKKYAGYMPITNELRYDSDANIARIVIEWLGNESRATANKLILAQIVSNGPATNFENLDGIKKALNVTLGSAFKGSSRIITNDDGLQYLDTLKKKSDSNEYLLTPMPSDPMRLRLAAGATTVPLEIVPNQYMPSTPTYTASVDTTVKAGKTYYTRTGAGTSVSPYVYTAVESPSGNPSTSSYYEMDATPQIPFIIGDLFEGVVYWDREWMSIAESAIASIGSFNAFEQDLTLYRAIEREDVTLRDTDAFVYGYIQPAADAGE